MRYAIYFVPDPDSELADLGALFVGQLANRSDNTGQAAFLSEELRLDLPKRLDGLCRRGRGGGRRFFLDLPEFLLQVVHLLYVLTIYDPN